MRMERTSIEEEIERTVCLKQGHAGGIVAGPQPFWVCARCAKVLNLVADEPVPSMSPIRDSAS
jgi:hypothetical protein